MQNGSNISSFVYLVLHEWHSGILNCMPYYKIYLWINLFSLKVPCRKTLLSRDASAHHSHVMNHVQSRDGCTDQWYIVRWEKGGANDCMRNGEIVKVWILAMFLFLLKSLCMFIQEKKSSLKQLSDGGGSLPTYRYTKWKRQFKVIHILHYIDASKIQSVIQPD